MATERSQDELKALLVEAMGALESATNMMDESAHRLRNLHTLLARELDEAVSRGRHTLTKLKDATNV